MSISDSNSSGGKCPFRLSGGIGPHWIVLIQSLDRKRVEAQLQEIELKSEKKKTEVIPSIIYDYSRSSPLVDRITDDVAAAPEAGWVR
jgi:hypothetical protein